MSSNETMLKGDLLLAISKYNFKKLANDISLRESHLNCYVIAVHIKGENNQKILAFKVPPVEGNLGDFMDVVFNEFLEEDLKIYSDLNAAYTHIQLVQNMNFDAVINCMIFKIETRHSDICLVRIFDDELENCSIERLLLLEKARENLRRAKERDRLNRSNDLSW